MTATPQPDPTGTARPDTARARTARPDTARPDTAHPNTAHPNTAHPNTAHPNTAPHSVAHPNAAPPSIARPNTAPPDTGPTRTGLFDAVLFDRDGTLVEDVPYNGDPDKVRPMPDAAAALGRLRAAGLRTGVVSNQSGIARGLLTAADVARVNARVDELLGPFDTWQVCPHEPDAGCRCRKPAPDLVHAAARALGTTAARCVVVGDIGADMGAALAAGATAILVPTKATRAEEVAAAPTVAADLTDAVDRILQRRALVAGGPPRAAGHVLVVRSDSAGDVLVTGPAIRAVAAGADRVTLLCGARGRAAAELLPGVDEIRQWTLPWIDPQPSPVDPAEVAAWVRTARYDQAVIFTSYHQSPLPLALLLRLAGVPRISAISDDYPGSLLDVRHRVPDGIPEPERALSLAAAAGFPLAGEPALRIADPAPPAGLVPPRADGGYVVVHPGASVPARACPPQTMFEIVKTLRDAGHRVLVTGTPAEAGLTAFVADGRDDLGGRTSLAGLAAVLRAAAAAVVANTGPAHLAAAVGTPVVSLFAPTVPFGQWAPWRVPVVRLGDAGAPCRDSRWSSCPVPGHPCLARIGPDEVLGALRRLGVWA